MSRQRGQESNSQQTAEKPDAAENSGRKRTIAHGTAPSACIVMKKKGKSNRICPGKVQNRLWKQDTTSASTLTGREIEHNKVSRFL
jgi:hypothetical protein